MNTGQGVIAEDIPLLHFDSHDDYIGTTKGLLNLVMQLDIGMFLGQQVSEIGVHFYPGDLAGKEQGNCQDKPQHHLRMMKNTLINVV